MQRCPEAGKPVSGHFGVLHFVRQKGTKGARPSLSNRFESSLTHTTGKAARKLYKGRCLETPGVSPAGFAAFLKTLAGGKRQNKPAVLRYRRSAVLHYSAVPPFCSQPGEDIPENVSESLWFFALPSWGPAACHTETPAPYSLKGPLLPGEIFSNRWIC